MAAIAEERPELVVSILRDLLALAPASQRNSHPVEGRGGEGRGPLRRPFSFLRLLLPQMLPRAIFRHVILGLSHWYSWVDSNHRPPDPQSGALTN